MRNPFKKHTEDHDYIWDVLRDTTFQLSLLIEEVNVLREELDFLIDELDD